MQFNKKKAAAVIGAGVIAVAGSGVAFAYFTSSGNGTGSATVGSAGSWGVAAGTTTGTMYPGIITAISTVPFTVTNNRNGKQAVTDATHLVATVVDDANGNIEQNGVALSGCKAVWFTPTVGTPSKAYGTSIAPTGTFTVSVGVTMSDSGTNQDSCQGASPDINLAVTSG
ncbi:MAG: hypothetical protein ACTHK4_01200 [Mycobacteriales bacterium]